MESRITDPNSLLLQQGTDRNFIFDSANTGHEQNGQSEPARFKTYSAGELVNSDLRIDYLVDGILAADHPGMIVAAKTLKTTLSLDLAISLSSGRPFLGYWPVNRRCRVGMMSGESGLPTIKETIERITKRACVDPQDIGLYVTADLPYLTSKDHREVRKIEKWIDQFGIEVLIIDPVYLCLDLGGNEGSLFGVGAVVRPVMEMCRLKGVTLLMAHHAKQAANSKHTPPEFQDASWAGFQQLFRQWVSLGRRESYHDDGFHKLWLRAGGSMGHGGTYAIDVTEGLSPNRHWEVDVHSVGDARRQEEIAAEQKRAESQSAKRSEDRRRILSAANNYPEGETKRALREMAGLTNTRASDAIYELIQEKRLEICNVKKRGRDETGYKLTGE